MTSTLLPSPKLNTPKIAKLSNGFTIVAEQMPVDAVNLNLWLNVGSTLESDTINGMAHFLEHMVFKGTKQLASGEFERLIEQRGAVTNAATSQEYTHYYITTAPQDFAELAPLQLEVVLNPTIPDEAFERERLVVLEEIRRSADNPRRRTYYRTMEAAFEQLPYRRHVLGPGDVIAGLQPQQMRDFHHQWYQPQSITVSVVGNLPVDELISIVQDNLEELPSAQTQSRPQFEPESTVNSIVRHEYVDSSLQQGRLVMMWRVPGLNQLNQTYGLDVLSAILGQGKMSRLFRDLREERALVSRIGVSNINYLAQGVFYISARLPTENITIVETAITEHIRKLQTELVADSEINRIRTQVANRFIFANERPSARANLYGYYYSLLGDLVPALEYPHRIQNLDARDLQAAAQHYLSPDAYSVVVIRPE